MQTQSAACDCHTHVLGPYSRFPLAANAAHVPAEASAKAHLAMLDAAGFERAVVVHPGVYGWDYSALLDALAKAPGRLRGVAVATSAIDDSSLAALKEAGVRALRYTEVRARGGAAAADGKAVFTDFHANAARHREHGMHAEFWADCDHFVTHAHALARHGVPLVLDHSGLFELSQGVDGAAFRDLLAMLRDGLLWIKLTMHRNSARRGEFGALRPFHDALLSANPDRLVWGSDWPYLGVTPPFAATELRDLLLDWSADAQLRQKILVTNPARLYGFGGADA